MVEAAKRNPVDVAQLSAGELSRLIRLCLFDLGPVALRNIDPLDHERVIERLLAAVEKHADDTTDEFHSWFFDKRDNLIRQISKQKKNGGPIDKEVVRQVLLENVYTAYSYIADCVDVAMHAFANALAVPLLEKEHELFARFYYQSPDLGNLPLLMLHDQFQNHRQVILKIIANPAEQRHVGVLLRMMEFTAEMTTNRREADRRYKAIKLGANETAFTITADEAIAGGATSDADIGIKFSEFADLLRFRRGLTCECADGDWIAKAEPPDAAGIVTFKFGCSTCGHCEDVESNIEELQAIVAGL